MARKDACWHTGNSGLAQNTRPMKGSVRGRVRRGRQQTIETKSWVILLDWIHPPEHPRAITVDDRVTIAVTSRHLSPPLPPSSSSSNFLWKHPSCPRDVWVCEQKIPSTLEPLSSNLEREIAAGHSRMTVETVPRTIVVSETSAFHESFRDARWHLS